MVIIHVAGGKGSQRFIVEAVRRGRSGFDDVAFVKAEFNFARHIFLRGFHKRLECFAERCEPFSLVDDLGELGAEFFLGFHCVAVQDQLLQLIVGFHQDGSSGGLINPAGFHADDAVFHDIDNSDSVLAAKAVELSDDLGNLHGFAVQCFGNTCLECHGDIRTAVRCLFRRYAENQHIVEVRCL